MDHAVPPDAPLRSFFYMFELIRSIAEGRPVPGPDDESEREAGLGPIERLWSRDMHLGDDEEEEEG